jgi:hypothetical protein
MQTINPKAVEFALEHVGERDFEKFSNAFFASVLGVSFVPLGGFNDGGADGYIRANEGRSREFTQSSKTKDPTVQTHNQ